MKLKKTTIGERTTLGMAVLVLGVLAAGCEQATSGARVASYEQPQVALVVIDMQKDFLDPGGKLPALQSQVADAVEHVNKLIDGARPGGVRVIYVRSEFPKSAWLRNWQRGYAALEGDPGAELDPRVHQVGKNVVAKLRGDAFSSPEFVTLLAEGAVDHIVLVGADNANGIRLTAEGGRSRGFKVQVLRDSVVSSSDRARDRMISNLLNGGAEGSDSNGALTDWTRRRRYLSR